MPPTAPGLSGSSPTGSSRTQGAARNPESGTNSGAADGPGSARRPHSSAPTATDKIVITGITNGSASASGDHPLLPITGLANSLGIRSGTPIQVKLRSEVDSGHAHNGDMLDGTLTAPVGGLSVGTPVRLTVVAAAPAGALSSFGELSLQVVSIGDHRVLSDTITAEGTEGAKELPDAAPSRGTNAIFKAGQIISLPAA